MLFGYPIPFYFKRTLVCSNGGYFLIEADEIDSSIFEPFGGRRDLFILPVLGVKQSDPLFLRQFSVLNL